MDSLIAGISMNKSLFQQLVIAALTSIAGNRTSYPEAIAKEAVRIASATLAEIEREEGEI